MERNRNIISGGRHGDKLWRQCWGTASGGRRHACTVREIGLSGDISVSKLLIAILFVVFQLLLRLLFIIMMLVDTVLQLVRTGVGVPLLYCLFKQKFLTSHMPFCHSLPCVC